MVSIRGGRQLSEVHSVMVTAWDEDKNEVGTGGGVGLYSPTSPTQYWSDGDSFLSDIYAQGERFAPLQDEDIYSSSWSYRTPSPLAPSRHFLRVPECIWNQLKEILRRTVNTASRREIMLKLAVYRNRETVAIWLISSALSRTGRLRGILRNSILRDGSSIDEVSRSTVHWCPNLSCVWSYEYFAYLEAQAVVNPDSCLSTVERLEEICGLAQDPICDGSMDILDSMQSALTIIAVALHWNLCSDCWIYILAELNTRAVPGPGHLSSSSLQAIGDVISGTRVRMSTRSREGSPRQSITIDSLMNHGNSGMRPSEEP